MRKRIFLCNRIQIVTWSISFYVVQKRNKGTLNPVRCHTLLYFLYFNYSICLVNTRRLVDNGRYLYNRVWGTRNREKKILIFFNRSVVVVKWDNKQHVFYTLNLFGAGWLYLLLHSHLLKFSNFKSRFSRLYQPNWDCI